MAAIFAFKCSCCGELHEGSPSIGYRMPDQYASLSDEQKAAMGKLSSDFCTITHEAGTDHFIRAVLEVPIHGVEEPFLWGVWVSLSEKSFARYVASYDDPVAGDGFFGWVCNAIPAYPFAAPRPADVAVQLGGQRPKVILHRGDPENDPLVIDQVNGISIARAQEIAERALHGTQAVVRADAPRQAAIHSSASALTVTMIFAFVEDGTLEVHADLASVQRQFEGVDVESGVVHFYDVNGVYLSPHFIVPNQRGKSFGLFPWVVSGVFELVPNPSANQDSFALALYETQSLAPNPWFANLDVLKAELAGRGVAVEFDPGRQASGIAE